MKTSVALFIFMSLSVRSCYSHKFSVIKEIIHDVSIAPGNIYYESSSPSVCFCNEKITDYDSLGSVRDSDEYVNDVIYLYSYVSGRDCSTKSSFVAYRVDIVSRTIKLVLCNHLAGYVRPEDCLRSTPPAPGTCPNDCVKMIGSIPKGEKGETGDTGQRGPSGERGPTGPKGEPGSGHIGIAPSRRLVNPVDRTYFDVAKALQNYTGCSLDQGFHYLWYTDVRYPTYCKTTWVQQQNLKDILTRKVRTGYVVLWYWGGEQLTLRFAAYRTLENDVVPVICDPSFGPIFFPRLEIREEDLVCPIKQPSPEVPSVDGDENVSVFWSFVLWFSLLLGFPYLTLSAYRIWSGVTPVMPGPQIVYTATEFGDVYPLPSDEVERE